MELEFREIDPADIQRVADLLADLYHKNVRRYYSDEADVAFRKYISAAEIKKRIKKNTKFITVFENEEFIGGMQFSNKEIDLFFVVEDHRGKGYSRNLINWLKSFFTENNYGNKITVKASPNSYKAYSKLGFNTVGTEIEDKGMVYKKMALTF